MNILFVCVVCALSSVSVSETITPSVGEKPIAKESPPVIIDHGGLIPPSPATFLTAKNVTVSLKPISPEEVAKDQPLLPGPQIISEKDDVEINQKSQGGEESSKSLGDNEYDGEEDEEAGDDDGDDDGEDEEENEYDDGKTELDGTKKGMMTGDENWEKYKLEKEDQDGGDDEEKSEEQEKDKEKDSEGFQPGSASDENFPELIGNGANSTPMTTEPVSASDNMFEDDGDDDGKDGHSGNDDEDIGNDDEDDDDEQLEDQDLLPVGDGKTEAPIDLNYYEEHKYTYDDDYDETSSEHNSDPKDLISQQKGVQEKSGHGASAEIVKVSSSTNFKFSVGLFIIVVVTVLALFIYWNWNTVERFILLRRLTPGRKRARGADEEKLLGKVYA